MILLKGSEFKLGICTLLTFPSLLHPSEGSLPHLDFCWSQSAYISAFHQALGAEPHSLQLNQKRYQEYHSVNVLFWIVPTLGVISSPPQYLSRKNRIASKPHFHKYLFCLCRTQSFYPNGLWSKWKNLHHASSATFIHACSVITHTEKEWGLQPSDATLLLSSPFLNPPPQTNDATPPLSCYLQETESFLCGKVSWWILTIVNTRSICISCSFPGRTPTSLIAVEQAEIHRSYFCLLVHRGSKKKNRQSWISDYHHICQWRGVAILAQREWVLALSLGMEMPCYSQEVNPGTWSNAILLQLIVAQNQHSEIQSSVEDTLSHLLNAIGI